MDDIHAVELAEHRNAPFPASVEKGRDYGEVDPVLIDADIFGWASQDRLDGAQKRSLRQAADELARSLDAFPADALGPTTSAWSASHVAPRSRPAE